MKNLAYNLALKYFLINSLIIIIMTTFVKDIIYADYLV